MARTVGDEPEDPSVEYTVMLREADEDGPEWVETTEIHDENIRAIKSESSSG